MARREGWAALPWRTIQALPLQDAIEARLSRLNERGEIRPLWGHHRLLIPWRSPEGRIVAIQRRKIGEGPGPKYVLPWAPEWPYGADRLTLSSSMLIVEGAFDTLAARALYGLDVIGLPGIGGWQRRWAALLGGRRPLIGFDRGKPGADGIIPEDRAAARVALDCAGLDREPRPDACSLCGGPTPWLCRGCGRRRAPDGGDWAKAWANRSS